MNNQESIHKPNPKPVTHVQRIKSTGYEQPNGDKISFSKPKAQEEEKTTKKTEGMTLNLNAAPYMPGPKTNQKVQQTQSQQTSFQSVQPLSVNLPIFVPWSKTQTQMNYPSGTFYHNPMQTGIAGQGQQSQLMPIQSGYQPARAQSQIYMNQPIQTIFQQQQINANNYTSQSFYPQSQNTSPQETSLGTKSKMENYTVFNSKLNPDAPEYKPKKFKVDKEIKPEVKKEETKLSVTSAPYKKEDKKIVPEKKEETKLTINSTPFKKPDIKSTPAIDNNSEKVNNLDSNQINSAINSPKEEIQPTLEILVKEPEPEKQNQILNTEPTKQTIPNIAQIPFEARKKVNEAPAKIDTTVTKDKKPEIKEKDIIDISQGASKWSDLWNNKIKVPAVKKARDNVVSSGTQNVTYNSNNKNTKNKQGNNISMLKEKQNKYQEMLKNKQLREEDEQRQRELARQQQIEEEKRWREERLAQEEERKLKEKPKTKIEREYFIITLDKPKTEKTKKEYSLDYMISFKSWNICKEKKLLSTSVIDHLKKLEIYDDETSSKSKNEFSKGSRYNNNKKEYNNNSIHKNDSIKKPTAVADFRRENASLVESAMQQWGRKDISKEISLAEQFKEKLEEIKNKDPIKFDWTERLNILTVDNYEEIKNGIFEKIKDSVENQEKWLDVLFKKAIHEKSFVFIYARLCRELDRDLPQRIEKNEKNVANKKPISMMRSKLLDKCREIFKNENNTKLDNYFKVSDEEEREWKFKKFVLGNVNFIGEWIKIQMLNKKIVFQWIDNLFKRYDKNDGDEKLRWINLEGIVILTDKFGTWINKHNSKIKKEEHLEFTTKLDDILNKLNEVQDKDIVPGYIKYKIINWIEKKKSGWEETKFEKHNVAKGKDEVRKEYEESQRKGFNSNTTKNSNSKKYDQTIINDKIKDDLYSFRDYLDEGGDVKSFGWEIITDLYSRGNSIAEILIGFVETCIDFIQRPKTLKYSSLYFNELIRYYCKILKSEEKHEISKSCLELVSGLSNLTLDNPFLVNVFANIIYIFNFYGIMYYSLLGEWKDLLEDDLKSLFAMFRKIKDLDENAWAVFEKLYYVNDNRELFNSYAE